MQNWLLEWFHDLGVSFNYRKKDILLGGLRNGEGKKQIDMNSYMSKNDIHVMDELEKEGYHVFMQSVPTSQKLSTEEIKDKFNK